MKKSLLSIALGTILSTMSFGGYAISDGCEIARGDLADALLALRICKAVEGNCSVERARFHACVALAVNEDRGGICPNGDLLDQPYAAAGCLLSVDPVNSAAN